MKGQGATRRPKARSLLGKVIHSHPCREETATWMGHPSFLTLVEIEQQQRQ